MAGMVPCILTIVTSTYALRYVPPAELTGDFISELHRKAHATVL
jgi:hypothetical protein